MKAGSTAAGSTGLVSFYGLERAAAQERRQRPRDESSSGVFWLHAGSFAAYNALIGYLLYQRGEDGGERSLMLFAIAMGLHFVVNDYGIREHFRQAYDSLARWIFVGAFVPGWIVGSTTEVSEAAWYVLLAFLADGVILNVMKEELPEERESRFWAFAVGVIAYTVLLLSV